MLERSPELVVVMGISMGLFEETVYDMRNGKPVNNNYADYLVPVNADIPEIDVIFLDYPDKVMSEYGARGVGEIGLTGCPTGSDDGDLSCDRSAGA